MNNLFFTQFSVGDIRQLFRRELQTFFQFSREITPQTPDGKKLLTLFQAAQVLGTSEDELTRLAENNDILHYRHGHEYFFIEDEIKSEAA